MSDLGHDIKMQKRSCFSTLLYASYAGMKKNSYILKIIHRHYDIISLTTTQNTLAST